MAKYEVLESCRDLETGTDYTKNDIVDKPVKDIEDFEKRLDEAGYKETFFKRLEEKKTSEAKKESDDKK
ncbi:hypothetical protein MT339_09040 [Staphylococcus sp. NRL 19/737]|nr:hypothetical protein [Staphylococcus sp. NRL 19/737]MCJ1668541.1 hypothetical protein [Staphylococcus sp. NRL 19/737]